MALAFLGLFLVVPLVAVFHQAFEKGLAAYLAALREPMALAALKLTLLTAAIAVPLNLVFGVAAAWAIAKFDFPGKNALITLIDLPFAVSPVISGMVFILLFGRQGSSARGSRPTASRSSSPCRGCPGHHLRDLPLRGPRADPADAGRRAPRRKRPRGCSAPAAGRSSGA